MMDQRVLHVCIFYNDNIYLQCSVGLFSLYLRCFYHQIQHPIHQSTTHVSYTVFISCNSLNNRSNNFHSFFAFYWQTPKILLGIMEFLFRITYSLALQTHWNAPSVLTQLWLDEQSCVFLLHSSMSNAFAAHRPTPDTKQYVSWFFPAVIWWRCNQRFDMKLLTMRLICLLWNKLSRQIEFSLLFQTNAHLLRTCNFYDRIV